MHEVKPKKKQGKKPGHVVRLSKATWELVEKKRKVRETIDATIRRIAGLPAKGSATGARTFYVLPDSGIVLTKCRSLAEAKGAATILAVRKRAEPEHPIAVREVV